MKLTKMIERKFAAIEARLKPSEEPTLPTEVARRFLDAVGACHARTGSRKVSMAAAWIWAQEVAADLAAGIDVSTRPELDDYGTPTVEGAPHVDRILTAAGWDITQPPKSRKAPSPCRKKNSD
jgi:hypothetical protein